MSISSLTVRSKPKYKLILLGDQAVGKTCLIQQFVNGRFQQSQAPTVGIDFVVTNIQHKGKQYRLQLWDTAGQQRFKSLIPSYLKDSQCALILYDVSNKESFHNIDKWLDLYRENVDENAFVIVVGNKSDLKSKFHGSTDAHQICSKRGLEHFQVSAKTGKNVTELFHKIIEMIQDKYNQPILDQKILQNDDPTKLGQIAEVDEPPSAKIVKLKPIPNDQIDNHQKRNGRCC